MAGLEATGGEWMTTVQTWTGREARALRHALRMSIREFAAHLGVSERTVSKWEAGREAVQPRPEMQAALDRALLRASGEAVSRFCAAAGNEAAGPAAEVAGGYRVRSHKFIPAYIGAATAKSLHAISPERALTADELLSLEIDVQMLWTYCRHIQRAVEEGRDPVMPSTFG